MYILCSKPITLFPSSGESSRPLCSSKAGNKKINTWPLLLSQVAVYLAQEGSFFPAFLVLPCQALGGALIRNHNAHTLPARGEPFHCPLLELETQFPMKDDAKTTLTRGNCQLLHHPRAQPCLLCRTPAAPSHFCLLSFSSQTKDESRSLKKQAIWLCYSTWSTVEKRCLQSVC